jgi:hypothetical protein
MTSETEPIVNRSIDGAVDTGSVHEAIPEHPLVDQDDDESDAENPELGFDNWEDDWIDDDQSEDEVEENDEEILAMDDMYGPRDNFYD